MYRNINIKQYSKEIYLGCELDVALKVINKINSRLRFLYRKSRHLSSHLKTLLCNAKKQNKCIRFCLQLDSIGHIRIKEFEQINWLLVSKRFYQCICSNTFKLFNGDCPLMRYELYDFYKPPGKDQINTRSSVLKLKHPSSSTCSGQNTLSFLTPTIWNMFEIIK